MSFWLGSNLLHSNLMWEDLLLRVAVYPLAE